MSYGLGKMMALGGFGIRLLAILVREFLLAFMPDVFIEAYLQQNAMLTVLTVALVGSTVLAAAGFGVMFLSGGGLNDLAIALLLAFSPFAGMIFGNSFTGFAGSAGLQFIIHGGVSISTMLTTLLSLLYLPAWAWKFKDKSILVSVLLVGAFFVELLIPLLSPSIDRFTMVTFFSVIISLLYVGCAAVPVLAAFAEDQE